MHHLPNPPSSLFLMPVIKKVLKIGNFWVETVRRWRIVWDVDLWMSVGMMVIPGKEVSKLSATVFFSLRPVPCLPRPTVLIVFYYFVLSPAPSSWQKLSSPLSDPWEIVPIHVKVLSEAKSCWAVSQTFGSSCVCSVEIPSAWAHSLLLYLLSQPVSRRETRRLVFSPFWVRDAVVYR